MVLSSLGFFSFFLIFRSKTDKSVMKRKLHTDPLVLNFLTVALVPTNGHYQNQQGRCAVNCRLPAPVSWAAGI